MARLLTLQVFKWVMVFSTAALVACSAAPPAGPGSPSDPTVNSIAKPKAEPPPAVNEDSADKLPSAPPLNGAVQPERYTASEEREVERGGASWYGLRFHGRRTANGERYDMNAFTAAHKTLPFGTMVRVKSLVNGREVLVRITDRGPFIRNRVIDLSRAAAVELDMLSLGFKQVALSLAEGDAVTQPPELPKRRRR